MVLKKTIMRKINELNILVIGEALLLLVVTLGILGYFSHKTLKQEALHNAEQTLEGTMQHIDNMAVLSVLDQATILARICLWPMYIIRHTTATIPQT